MIALLKETVSEWSEDKAPRLGAALAFYTVFSLAPLLVIVIAIAGLVFGQEAAQGRIDDQIQGLIGRDGADLVQAMIESARRPQDGILATVVGVVTLLFGALGAFGQLQEALNTIWEVVPKPGRGLKGILRDRLTPAALVLGMGFLLLASLVVSAGLAALGNFLTGYLHDIGILTQIINFVISFLVITVMFATMFKYLPDVRIAWRDVWIGAALTALLFNIGKLFIGLYLGSRNMASTYGAAGSLIIVLLWIYYSAQILFFGAEFTQVWTNRYGSKIQPAANAVWITEAARAQQGIPRPEAVQAAAREEVAAPHALIVAEARLDLPAALPDRPQRNHVEALVGFAAGVGAGILFAAQAYRRGENRSPGRRAGASQPRLE